MLALAPAAPLCYALELGGHRASTHSFNVWADLSGLLVGDAAYFARLARSDLLRRTVERIKQGIVFTERPDRFLYGTDWPLAPMREYQDFVRQLFPEECHQAVFHENAAIQRVAKRFPSSIR
jgi:predicted TIM-barrel fold metal-dependent hydrolase